MGLTACSNDNVSDADSSNSAENKDLTGKTSFSITSRLRHVPQAFMMVQG